jgi:hypothetical protein
MAEEIIGTLVFLGSFPGCSRCLRVGHSYGAWFGAQLPRFSLLCGDCFCKELSFYISPVVRQRRKAAGHLVFACGLIERAGWVVPRFLGNYAFRKFRCPMSLLLRSQSECDWLTNISTKNTMTPLSRPFRACGKQPRRNGLV